MAHEWYPRTDAVTRAFLESLDAAGCRPPHEMTVAELREADREMASSNVPKAPCEVLERVETLAVAGASRRVTLRLVRPERAEASSPMPAAVLYLHGGGWVSCDGEVYDRFVRDLAAAAGAVVVFVEYSRAPEARYPVAVEEGLAVLSWLSGHGADAGVDPRRIAVAGDSAGGNLAAAVTIAAKDRGVPSPRCQVLLCPVTDATGGAGWPSWDGFGDGPIAGARDLAWFWDHYLPDRSRRAEPTASPLSASLAQLAGLPPALVITAEFDTLRDQGEAYASKLMEAGVPVVATRYLGTIHAFMAFDELVGSPASRAAIDQIGSFLREHLSPDRARHG